MRDAKKIRLRHAYLGALTAEQIARAHAISKSVLHRFWADEKAAGNLPAVRPHFVERSRPTPPPSIEDRRDMMWCEVFADDDGEDNRRFAAPTGALLDLLRKHHGAIDYAHAHQVPRAWLRLDHPGAPAPRRDMQRAMCTAFDAGAYR
ncbi:MULTISPECIES: hypothetical protein [unclassified Bradyrhizobium]|uniref:hypothetical protein n=1 Tax=unclassified Bradyrhizobium TaxID=2631580 RepID=UPI002916E5CF|nr:MULTISPECIES: hypothetical protein [unclassified Bradyrhizobium]